MTTDPIAAALKVLANVGMYPTRSTMQAAIDAYEAAEAIQRQCDEPGCTTEAEYGFAVHGGYRRTCGAHLASEDASCAAWEAPLSPVEQSSATPAAPRVSPTSSMTLCGDWPFRHWTTGNPTLTTDEGGE